MKLDSHARAARHSEAMMSLMTMRTEKDLRLRLIVNRMRTIMDLVVGLRLLDTRDEKHEGHPWQTTTLESSDAFSSQGHFYP